MKNKEDIIKRYRVKIMGVVQGVGYRPYVYNQALDFKIKGWVSNHGSALVMDIEGETKAIKEFLLKIVKEPPDLATIERIEVIKKEPGEYGDFHIKSSSWDKDKVKFISVDVATCPDCLKDINNPLDPRYGYAFTNCTACGPRYSIIKSLPYDRKNTTMDRFEMCSRCWEEYTNPRNRRFHAQPNCCPHCGPSLKLLNSKGEEIPCENPVKATIDFIKEGNIVAIKGLGGFHLVCNAEDEEAIKTLRRRKNRPHKPFALMVKDMDKAKELAFIDEKEEALLFSNKRPILILTKRRNALPQILAPNTKKIGIMLPYTPLHHQLFQEEISFLVMTSGNISGGPIQYENKGVVQLANIADIFLMHDRPINIPVEDSVVKVVEGKECVIRRARGYTPYIINMKVNKEILALGAEQKNTFCLSKNSYGYLSQYLGDLKDFDAYTTYDQVIKNLAKLIDFTPKLVACDLDIKALPSQYAQYMECKTILVQHHHAHMVSCMVEHHIDSPVIAVVFDGTGLGDDGNIWGGEFLFGTKNGFKRVAHLQYITVQGGDRAIKEPWRVALSYLRAVNHNKNILEGISPKEINGVKKGLDAGINCFTTSSMGRFFDCVASLLNIRHRTTYEAQGAIELENTIDTSVKESYKFSIEKRSHLFQLGYKSIVDGILEDLEKGVSVSTISTKFHNTIARGTVDLVCRISKAFGIKQVVLSGGVFENNYLLSAIVKELEERNFSVYYNQQIPINDGGISVGQLAIADARRDG